MVHALLAACIAASSHTVCSTRQLAAGTYKLITADSSHRLAFSVTASNPRNAEHEATLEPYIGDAGCEKTSPIDGLFSLFPGASHAVAGQLESGRSLCVRVYKGVVTMSTAPGGLQSEVTWESQTTGLHSLASVCSVRATRLQCQPVTLTTGTWRIVTAGTDDVQAGLAFVGGYHRPGPDGRITTRVDLAKKAGDLHLFTSNASCPQTDPRMKMHMSVLDQTFHDGGQESLNTVINSGSSLCASVLGTITLVTP